MVLLTDPGYQPRMSSHPEDKTTLLESGVETIISVTARDTSVSAKCSKNGK